MDSEQQEAFMILQSKSCGLQETFLTAANDLILTDDSAEYAIEACEDILRAIKLIKGEGK